MQWYTLPSFHHIHTNHILEYNLLNRPPFYKIIHTTSVQNANFIHRHPYFASKACLILSTIACLSPAVVALPTIPLLFECINALVLTITTSKLPVIPRSFISCTCIKFPNSCSRYCFKDRVYGPYPHPPQYWIVIVNTLVSNRPGILIWCCK